MPSPLRTHVRKALGKLWLASPLARPPLAADVDLAVWYAKFARWCADNPCPAAPSRDEFYSALWQHDHLDRHPVCYLEFGSAAGASMRRALALNRHPASVMVGFDSFRGLPEPWRGFDAGHFGTGGVAPEIDDSRATFVPGTFQQSLTPFLAAYRPAHRQVVLLDADLFSSTLYALMHMGPFLRRGDVLVFDEFHAWMDEFRAFSCFLAAFPVRYTVLLATRGWAQCALQITSNPYTKDSAAPVEMQG